MPKFKLHIFDVPARIATPANMPTEPPIQTPTSHPSSTLTTTPPGIVFTGLGDKEASEAAAAKSVKSWNPDFITTGENSYQDGGSANSLQAQWLQLSLAAADAAWNIVNYHHAPFFSGADGCSAWMQSPFKLRGASAANGGHDHLDECLYILGLPAFINGSGGLSLYDFREEVDGSQVRYNDAFKAKRIEAGNNKITFSFINISGREIDELSISEP